MKEGEHGVGHLACHLVQTKPTDLTARQFQKVLIALIRGPAAQRGAPDEAVAVWRVCPRLGGERVTELEHMLGEAGQAELDEQGEAAAAIAERVQRLTRTYADFANVDFDFYYNRLRDLGMAQTLDMLGSVERESLALSGFLKDQLDRIKANDFSVPAIHISSVMEVEIGRCRMRSHGGQSCQITAIERLLSQRYSRDWRSARTCGVAARSTATITAVAASRVSPST